MRIWIALGDTKAGTLAAEYPTGIGQDHHEHGQEAPTVAVPTASLDALPPATVPFIIAASAVAGIALGLVGYLYLVNPPLALVLVHRLVLALHSINAYPLAEVAVSSTMVVASGWLKTPFQRHFIERRIEGISVIQDTRMLVRVMNERLGAPDQDHCIACLWDTFVDQMAIIEIPYDLLDTFCRTALDLGLPLEDPELSMPALIARYLTPHFGRIHALLDLDEMLYGEDDLGDSAIEDLTEILAQAGIEIAQIEFAVWQENQGQARKDAAYAKAVAGARADSLIKQIS